VSRARAAYGSAVVPAKYTKAQQRYELADKAEPSALFEFDLKKKEFSVGSPYGFGQKNKLRKAVALK
jgi:hypothetical protein